jgi:hypothetical protein
MSLLEHHIRRPNGTPLGNAIEPSLSILHINQSQSRQRLPRFFGQKAIGKRLMLIEQQRLCSISTPNDFASRQLIFPFGEGESLK